MVEPLITNDQNKEELNNGSTKSSSFITLVIVPVMQHIYLKNEFYKALCK